MVETNGDIYYLFFLPTDRLGRKSYRLSWPRRKGRLVDPLLSLLLYKKCAFNGKLFPKRLNNYVKNWKKEKKKEAFLLEKKTIDNAVFQIQASSVRTLKTNSGWTPTQYVWFLHMLSSLQCCIGSRSTQYYTTIMEATESKWRSKVKSRRRRSIVLLCTIIATKIASSLRVGRLRPLKLSKSLK